MLGELVIGQRIDAKKKITSSVSDAAKDHEDMDSGCTPPFKKLKQARLPFKPLDSSSPSPSNQHSKKRKLSGGEKISQSPKNAKISKEHAEMKTVNERLSLFKYQKGLESENEVSSSSETDKTKELIVNLDSVSTKTVLKSDKAKKLTLDSFVQKAQQPLVSTSEADVIDLTDSTDNDDAIQAESSREGIKCEMSQESGDDTITANHSDQESYDKAIEAVVSRAQKDSFEDEINSSSNSTDTSGDVENETNIEPGHVETSEDLEVEEIRNANKTEDAVNESTETCKSGGIDNKNNDDNDKNDKEEELVAERSPFKNQNVADISTPKCEKHVQKKTPKSTKALAKEVEKQKKMEDREKQRQEKQRMKEEALREKIRLKEEARAAKEKEREEIRKQKELEKENKERERRERKEKEEKEKLEKLQAKEEERKRKQEIIDAKNEEKRMKDEEKRKIEEEKKRIEEEKLLKKQKLQNTFKGFFKKVETTSKPKETTTQGLFMPFQLKQDMVLAPKCRVEKSMDVCKENVDQYLKEQNASALYLDELRNRKIKPGRTGKTTLQPKNESSDYMETGENDDVQVIETAADKITEVDQMRAKLLQFHENYRPAYFGTCLKNSRLINPRKPFNKDEEVIDYEFDSDEEWEEPGETLSNSEGEVENNEDSDDSEDDGFFVPHGYLSEGEGCAEDDDVEAFRAKREAKAKSWEAELKRQCQPKLPIVYGCMWSGDDVTGKRAEIHNILQKYKVGAFVTVPIATSFTVKSSKQADDESAFNNSGDAVSTQRSTSSIKKPVPEEAMSDLIRLVHGNTSGIKTLIKEFREYWKQKLCGSDKKEVCLHEAASTIVEKAVDTKRAEFAKDDPLATLDTRPPTPLINEEYVISKRQLDLKINAIAVREKQAVFKKVCWYVHPNVLDQYKLTDLPVPNQWQYITKTPKGVAEALGKDTDGAKGNGRSTPNIMQFTRPVSPSSLFEKAKTAMPEDVCEKLKAAKNDDDVLMTIPTVKPILVAFQNQKVKPSQEMTGNSRIDDQEEAMDVDDGYTADSDSDADDCIIVENSSKHLMTSCISDDNLQCTPTMKTAGITQSKSPRGQQTLLAMFKPVNPDDRISVKPLSPTGPFKPSAGTQSAQTTTFVPRLSVKPLSPKYELKPSEDTQSTKKTTVVPTCGPPLPTKAEKPVEGAHSAKKTLAASMGIIPILPLNALQPNESSHTAEKTKNSEVSPNIISSSNPTKNDDVQPMIISE